jgi:hypothetical protein
LIRHHVLTAALALLLVGLLACNGEADRPAEEGQLTDEETRYLVTANRILADSNAAFGSIRKTLIGIETANDSAVAPLAEQLQEMNEEATDLEAPGRFSEEQSLLLTALDRMAQIAEQVAIAMEDGDEESLAAARVRAEEAFDLLKQASAAFIEEGRR